MLEFLLPRSARHDDGRRHRDDTVESSILGEGM